MITRQPDDMTGIQIYDKLVANSNLDSDFASQFGFKVAYENNGSTYYGYLQSTNASVGDLKFCLDDQEFTMFTSNSEEYWTHNH